MRQVRAGDSYDSRYAISDWSRKIEERYTRSKHTGSRNWSRKSSEIPGTAYICATHFSGAASLSSVVRSSGV